MDQENQAESQGKLSQGEKRRFVERSGDPIGIGDFIRGCFPEAKIEFCENFDDIYCGYDICFKTRQLVRICIDLNDPLRISVYLFNVYLYLLNPPTISAKKLYSGPIPANDEMEPDLSFIRHILRNLDAMG